MDVFEALYTTRAMRRVKEDPIPDEIIKSMIDSAIRAPSAVSYTHLTLPTIDRV